ncbi:Kinesin- protein 12 [Boothiomyces sp. JEL0838]|nr:Kinesin- protein 12 [Boothiomyces sp. JEL0838]
MSFNRVFDEDADQRAVFAESGVNDLIVQALKGYATTIFAFGQTGSGKTFTITGPEETTPETVGIVPRALSRMFEEISKQKGSKSISDIRIQASYLEIYNENVLDLLNPQDYGLPVRWTAERGFFVERLFIVDCDNLDDSLAVLEEGIRNRTTGGHEMNEHSSRSHSLLTIYLEINGFDESDGHPQQRYGKISFVDLAGSERVKESKPTLDTFTEALSINKSLLTLGKCISALADPKKSGGHVPFRDSKLTKLLSDSLGGKGSALMISCISPSQTNFNETLKTLRYAQQARKITNKPSIQLDPQEELLLNLKKEIKGLKQENLKLRHLLENDPQYSSILHQIIKESEENAKQYKSRPASPSYSRKSAHSERITQEIRLSDVKRMNERNLKSAKADNRIIHEHKFNQSPKIASPSKSNKVRKNSIKLPNIGKGASSRQDGAKTPSKQRVDEMKISYAPAGYPEIKPSTRHTRSGTQEPERPLRRESKPVVDKFLTEVKSNDGYSKKKVEIKYPTSEKSSAVKAPKTPHPKNYDSIDERKSEKKKGEIEKAPSKSKPNEHTFAKVQEPGSHKDSPSTSKSPELKEVRQSQLVKSPEPSKSKTKDLTKPGKSEQKELKTSEPAKRNKQPEASISHDTVKSKQPLNPKSPEPLKSSLLKSKSPEPAKAQVIERSKSPEPSKPKLTPKYPEHDVSKKTRSSTSPEHSKPKESVQSSTSVKPKNQSSALANDHHSPNKTEKSKSPEPTKVIAKSKREANSPPQKTKSDGKQKSKEKETKNLALPTISKSPDPKPSKSPEPKVTEIKLPKTVEKAINERHNTLKELKSLDNEIAKLKK